MFLPADRALEHIRLSVEDAKKRLGNDWFQVCSWPQTWSNTACGFPGVAGQAFTDAQTVIVSGDDDDLVLVYHNGRFAYQVADPTDEFWKRCGQRTLPGAVTWPRSQAELDGAACQR